MISPTQLPEIRSRLVTLGNYVLNIRGCRAFRRIGIWAAGMRLLEIAGLGLRREIVSPLSTPSLVRSPDTSKSITLSRDYVPKMEKQGFQEIGLLVTPDSILMQLKAKGVSRCTFLNFSPSGATTTCCTPTTTTTQ